MPSRKINRSKRSFKPRNQRAGAIYSFDLNDKIGGLPARIPLNGTADGDCPATDTRDLGFVNYGMTRPASGGGRHSHRSRKVSRSSRRRVSTKSRKTKRNTRK